MLLVFILFSVLYSHSQKFIVTSDGLRDAIDETKTYVVIECEGESHISLYNSTIKYINESMKNPDSSIKSDIPNDYIRYSVYVPDFVKYSNSGHKVQMSGKFDIEFRFKDGRVRYEIASLSMPAKDLKSNYEVVFKGSKWKTYPIFENNGKLFKEQTKLDIELFFNTLLADYIKYLKEGSDKDDW